MKCVKNFETRYSITIQGEVYSHLSNRFMKTYLDRDGYECLGLTRSDGVQVTSHVHRLVALTYLENPENLPCVNHKDGIKRNNHFKNLEWCTHQHNRLHALENNLVPNYRVHEESLAFKVISYIMDGWTKKEVSESLGVDSNKVHNIIFSNAYKYVRDEFDWENRPNKLMRLSTDKVISICTCLESGYSNKEIQRKFNISPQTLYSIKSRKSHKHISQNFNF